MENKETPELQRLPRESVTLKECPMPHHYAGLMYTRTGYGRKIPIAYKVQLPGETLWRRMYTCIFSNIGTNYVVKKGQWIIIY